ncbi:MAG: PDC sensor domain-containing protein, partial [Vicinamibacterales bacterium]
MKRISTRFALMMAAAAVVPLLAYGAVSIVSVRDGAQQAVIEGNQNVADRVGGQIELYITGSIRILNAVAADMQQTGLAAWQQDRILKNFVRQLPEFKELTLLDENGVSVASSRLDLRRTDLPGPDSLKIENALVSRVFVDTDVLPAVVVAIPTPQGTDRGWLVGLLQLEELWRTVDSIRVGETGYALIITHEGQLLAHGDPHSKSLVARRAKLNNHPVVLAMATAGAN